MLNGSPALSVILLAATIVGCTSPDEERPVVPQTEAPTSRPNYLLHRQIISTVFWVGEPANARSPSNRQSAWDSAWEEHFGGFDDPRRRNGFLPAGFEPKENPFYVALPYNDFSGGTRRADAATTVPWTGEKDSRGRLESMCKNRWIRVTKGERSCYAQWEDVGPFNTDDAAYVFGPAPPRNRQNQGAGIDVSPAVRDFLGVGGIDRVDWQFVDEVNVPDGPWKRVVTTRQIHWR